MKLLEKLKRALLFDKRLIYQCFIFIPLFSLFTSLFALFSIPSASKVKQPLFEKLFYERHFIHSNCDPGRWLYEKDEIRKPKPDLIFDPDPKELEACRDRVLSSENCSKDWFIYGNGDGNCRCVDIGTDCNDEENHRTHDAVDIYKISTMPFQAKKHFKILYIIRTYPKTYNTRLKTLEETWLPLLADDFVLIVGIANEKFQDSEIKTIKPRPNLKIIYPECKDTSHEEGICCQESNAFVEAVKSFTFDWMFIIDDDVFLAPQNLRLLLNHAVPWADVIGTWGCATEVRGEHGEVIAVRGFCGGHGYAFRYSAMKAMVYDDEKFLLEYRMLCEHAKLSDIVTGVIAERRRLKIFSRAFGQTVWNTNRAVYHRVHEEKMHRLHSMLNTKTEPFNFTYANSQHMDSGRGKFSKKVFA